MLGVALLPFSSERRLWATFKCDTIAKESLRGSVFRATEQERPEENLKQVPLSADTAAGVHSQFPITLRPAIKNRKATSEKQRHNSLFILLEGSLESLL